MPFVLRSFYVRSVCFVIFSLYLYHFDHYTWFPYSFKDDHSWRFVLFVFSSHSPFNKYFHHFSFETAFSEFFIPTAIPFQMIYLVHVSFIHALWRFLSIGSLFACMYVSNTLPSSKTAFSELFYSYLFPFLNESLYCVWTNGWYRRIFLRIYLLHLYNNKSIFFYNKLAFLVFFMEFVKKRWAEAHRIQSWIAR